MASGHILGRLIPLGRLAVAVGSGHLFLPQLAPFLPQLAPAMADLAAEFVTE